MSAPYWRDVLEQRDYDRAVRLLRQTKREATRDAVLAWEAGQAMIERVAALLLFESVPTAEIEQLAAAAADEVTRTATMPVPRSIPPPPMGSIAFKMAHLPLRRREVEPA